MLVGGDVSYHVCGKLWLCVATTTETCAIHRGSCLIIIIRNIRHDTPCQSLEFSTDNMVLVLGPNFPYYDDELSFSLYACIAKNGGYGKREARLRQRVSARLAPETAEEREARRRTRDRARRASESQARAVSRLQRFRANLARRIASESSEEREAKHFH